MNERPTPHRPGAIRRGPGAEARTQPAVRAEDVHVTRVEDTEAPELALRDRLRWGPILGGLLATVALMAFFTLLGLAIGLTVFDPESDPVNVARSAALWSAVSAVLAFFLGGWVTGKTADIAHDDNALLNGFMVAAAALVAIFWLSGVGLGNLFGLIGNSIGDLARLAADNPDIVRQTAPAEVDLPANQLFARAESTAWYSVAGLLLGFLAASLGGWVGHKSRHGLGLRTDLAARD